MSPSPPNSPPKKPNNPRNRAGQDLRLPALPGQFHPLFYEPRNNSRTNSPSTSRPSSSRSPLAPQAPARKGTPVQKQMQQMQQYHREVLARATSTLMSPAPPSDTPKAPHLAPHGSPGPTTPLTLGESSDYITAAAGPIGEGSPRSIADKYVRQEQERRSGMRTDQTSPAVSPRC